MKNDRKKYALFAFLINLAVALAVFVPFIIRGHGMLTMGDDFDAQELVFGMIANREIKEFDVFFNWAIDIGSDFITSFSFYNLGSPFFWITLLFKPEVYPYLVGWILILKYACAGFTSYLWLRKYAGEKYALPGSVLYAFSGFQAMNMIFYHFHDVVVFFPLLLMALEKRVEEKKKGIFALSVGISALVNWNFFVGEVIFLIIYYIVRYELIGRFKQKNFKEPLCEIGALMGEGVLGVGIAGVLFIPSVAAMLGNTRVTERIYMSDGIVWSPEYVVRMIKALLLPSEAMNFNSIFVDMDWYSIGLYLPMTGITLLAVYLFRRRRKKDWVKTMLIISFVIAVIPVLNSVFTLFYREPYRRWYFMPLIFMALATSVTMKENAEFAEGAEGKSIRKNLLVSCILVLLSVGAFWFCFRYWKWSEDAYSVVVNNYRFRQMFMIGAAGLVVTTVIVLLAKKEKLYRIAFLLGICGFAWISQVFTLKEYRQFAYYSSEGIANEILRTAEDIESNIIPYRYDMAEDYYNKNMAYSLTSMDSFISTVDEGIFEFYDSICTHRHVHTLTGPVGTSQILSAKYMIAEDLSAQQLNLDPAKLIETHDNGNDRVGIYEDPLTPPIGFTYDKFLTSSEFTSTVSDDMRAVAMLNYLIVPDNEVSKVEGILEHQDAGKLKVTESMLESGCEDRLKECSESFEVRRTGFTSVINADSDKYAFFSVPYSKRWSATVNGNKVEIIDSNGLMAVPVYAGENVIEFSYSIAINVVSAIISVISLLATVVILSGGKKK